MRVTFPLVIALALSLSFTGCIANMAEFKDKVGATREETITPAETVEPPAQESPPVAPVVHKAPVARITIFGTNGALVYKSTFAAEDPAVAVMVEEKSNLSLIASDSEALENGATITGFAWTLNGKPLVGARQANTDLPSAGIYTLSLTVTDSNGKTDAQSVKLAVAPSPIDIVTELTTGPVAGASGEGQAGTASFELKADGAGVVATIQKMSIVASSPATCDIMLEVTTPDGTVISKDDTGTAAAESAEFPSAAEGAYGLRALPFACVAPEGITITVTVTYLPIVPGFDGEEMPHQH